jgi:hypothetical protein
MEREQKWMRLSAAGIATAIALVITMGVPVAMQYGASPSPSLLVDAKPLPGDAVQVSIEPASIHVIAVRDRSTAGRWLSTLGQRPAG